jgi:hypothetical protein
MPSAHISELTPGPGERSITYGTSRSGKSALEDWRHIQVMRERPECLSIIVDTKPRYRAVTQRGHFRRGRADASWRYETWAKGPIVPNSVVMDIHDDKPFASLWREPGEVVLMQGDSPVDWRRMLYLIEAFTKAHIKGRERLIRVDEALDFYGRNTMGIDAKHDVFYRLARAGGERNIGLMLGAHRVFGIPPLINLMASRMTLFHLASDADMKYLNQIGVKDATSPDGDFVFRQWVKEKGGKYGRPFTGRAEYPQAYLDQLAST